MILKSKQNPFQQYHEQTDKPYDTKNYLSPHIYVGEELDLQVQSIFWLILGDSGSSNGCRMLLINREHTLCHSNTIHVKSERYMSNRSHQRLIIGW